MPLSQVMESFVNPQTRKRKHPEPQDGSHKSEPKDSVGICSNRSYSSVPSKSHKKRNAVQEEANNKAECKQDSEHARQIYSPCFAENIEK